MHCKRRMCSGLAIFLLTAALIVVYMQMNHYNFIVHTDSTHIKELLSESNQTFTTVPPESPRACSCTKCISEKGVSAWFDKRFNSSTQPLLTAKDDNLPQPALSWWLALQQSHIDVKVNEVVAEVFAVLPGTDQDMTGDPSQCRRCAVVGNSGNLRGSIYGNLIDSHDVVMRMNKAVTSGFESDVGRKTTHHFLYPESAIDLPADVHLVLVPFKTLDLQWIASALSTGQITKTYMEVKQFIKADKDKVMVISPAFLKYVNDKWTEHHGRYPSTGMLAVIFALHTCDEVSVFGYGADVNGNWHHYWEENKYASAFRKTGVHSADFETETLKKLVEEGKIRLYTPERTARPINKYIRKT
ncbi:CMP-N-acetylneuraminate-beta-galactosamide-alpha-2,3-sialyltransferase 2-like [Huso huso]|uniref:beta-galactoside alpha-2,3-sialyltransferase n=1 Tax=Huso huso TaxID=61971 RepID=A0ABR0YGE3_HUSHU